MSCACVRVRVAQSIFDCTFADVKNSVTRVQESLPLSVLLTVTIER